MPRPAALLLAVALAAEGSEAPARPHRLAAYVLAESRRSVSPQGERASAVRGRVVVLGGTARWDLESGSFPRTSADALLLGDRGGWLVDRKAASAARAGLEELRALFVTAGEGDPGPFQARVRDVVLGPAEESRGPAFEGRPTVRVRMSASWSLAMSMPGREARVRSRLTAVFDVLVEAPPEARSPLDDLGRLLDAPAAVRDALAPELAKVRGLPVGAVVETEAELVVDYPGATPPTPDGRAPTRTRTEATRVVSGLATRPAAEEDLGRFSLAEETRVVGIERLVPTLETLR